MHGASDHRDSRSWVVIELTHAGEMQVEEGNLEPLLREFLGVDASHPIFIPSVSYTNRGRRTTIHLMEGYAFVLTGLPEPVYFALEGTCPYVRRILSSKSPNGMRVLSVIPDSSVQEMRQKLALQVSSDVKENMHVVVTDGPYNRLDGDVLEIDGDSAHVRFVMRSLDLIARIPKVFLAPTKEEDEP